MNTTATIIVFEEDSYNSMYEVLFADVINDPDIHLIVEKIFPEHSLYKYLQSRKLKRLTLGLSDKAYLTYYRLPKVVNKLSKRYKSINILFHNACLRKTRYPLTLFKYLKKFNVTLNLLYLDTYSRTGVCGYANFLSSQHVFDRVMTFDPNDAQKYGFEYHTTPYSKIEINPPAECVSGLYFCGGNIGRIYTIYKIWQNAIRNNVPLKCDFIFCNDFRPFFENDPNICFHSAFIKYPDVLRETTKYNCILDITQSNQSGYTLRPYEAVVYNKKLLTNNKHIYNFKYYDSRYMQYFEHEDDIDWEWIKKPITINYNYQGEFSPKHLIDDLKRKI